MCDEGSVEEKRVWVTWSLIRNFVWQNKWAVKTFNGHFLRWYGAKSLILLFSFSKYRRQIEAGSQAAAPTDDMNNILTWWTDWLTVWAAAGGTKSPFFSSANQTWSQKQCRSKPPTLFHTCTLMYASHTLTHTHHQGLSLLWHKQQSTLWPPAQVTAVIIDITVIWGSDLTVHSHFVCVHHVCLSSGWMSEVWPELLLLILSSFLLHIQYFYLCCLMGPRWSNTGATAVEQKCYKAAQTVDELICCTIQHISLLHTRVHQLRLCCAQEK